jgi:hypothetical protein
MNDPPVNGRRPEGAPIPPARAVAVVDESLMGPAMPRHPLKPLRVTRCTMHHTMQL